jgi:hypothetical protein
MGLFGKAYRDYTYGISHKFSYGKPELLLHR